VAVSPPGATRVLVAGQGNREDRQFIEMTSTDATAAEALWGRRIERFVDQRNTNDEEEELTRSPPTAPTRPTSPARRLTDHSVGVARLGP
jgi:hypothetical protein